MKHYQLIKSDYSIKKQLHIERLELDNILALEYFTDSIQFLIDSFNKEYHREEPETNHPPQQEERFQQQCTQS